MFEIIYTEFSTHELKSPSFAQLTREKVVLNDPIIHSFFRWLNLYAANLIMRLTVYCKLTGPLKYKAYLPQ